MRLVVQIQAVADQLFEIDLRRTFEAALAIAAIGAAIAATVAASRYRHEGRPALAFTASAAGTACAGTATFTARPPRHRPVRSAGFDWLASIARSSSGSPAARYPPFLESFFGLHACFELGPFQRDTSLRTQPDMRCFLAGEIGNQLAAQSLEVALRCVARSA